MRRKGHISSRVRYGFWRGTGAARIDRNGAPKKMEDDGPIHDRYFQLDELMEDVRWPQKHN